MTKKSFDRRLRDEHNIPKATDVAAADRHVFPNKVVFVKKNMLENQIYRDGPKIARSFDRFTKPYIRQASEVYSRSSALLLRHLPNIEKDDVKATSSRLLFNALNSYVASIEAARHGYRRQFGTLSRSILEGLATVITILTQDDALEKFHEDKLSSSWCIGCAKKIMPPMGMYYGMLSKEFVHIGKSQSILEPPSLYEADQQALSFIINGFRSNIWLIMIVAEMVFHDEVERLTFWEIVGDGQLKYAPSAEAEQWSGSLLDLVTPETLTASLKPGKQRVAKP